MSKHTPGPLVVTGKNESGWFEIGGAPIVHEGDFDIPLVAACPTEDDAERVVRTANAHDQLVEALRIALRALEFNATANWMEIDVARNALKEAGVEP